MFSNSNKKFSLEKIQKIKLWFIFDIKDKFAQNKIDFFIKRAQKNSKKLNYKLDQIIKTIYQEQVKLITKNYLQEYNVWINWRNRF